MAVGAGAALHRKPHRLVQHQHVVVLVERDRLDEGAVLLVAGGVVARLRRLDLERRDADRLALLQPVLGLRALAVHPHLAFADDALDVAERQARIARLEEAVEPHAVLVGADGDGLHALAGLRLAGAWISVSVIGSRFRRRGRPSPRSPRPANGYAATRGKRNHQSATTRKPPAPPNATASGAPTSAATAPARKSPSWLEVPVNRPLTALTRPRISAGCEAAPAKSGSPR